ncbi:MAG: hypothetical protein ACOYT7_03290 [Patescibacteria group bacterium]
MKHYKNENSQTLVYYRCTKKLAPCTQKYIEETKLEEQLRKEVSSLSLPDSWSKDWFSWLEKDKEKGLAWLEPFGNFINLAFQARKIASSKNAKVRPLGRAGASAMSFRETAFEFVRITALGGNPFFRHLFRLALTKTGL